MPSGTALGRMLRRPPRSASSLSSHRFISHLLSDLGSRAQAAGGFWTGTSFPAVEEVFFGKDRSRTSPSGFMNTPGSKSSAQPLALASYRPWKPTKARVD
jgi:hypothetical protein